MCTIGTQATFARATLASRHLPFCACTPFLRMHALHLLRIHGTDDESQDFLGCAKTQMSSIIGSAGMQLTLPIEYNGRSLPRSKMILRAEKLQESGSEDFSLQMQMKGRALAKKDWFGKSDPYVQFCRLRPDGTFDVVYVVVLSDARSCNCCG